MLRKFFDRNRDPKRPARRPARLGVTELERRDVPSRVYFNFSYDPSLASNAGLTNSLAAAGTLLTRQLQGTGSTDVGIEVQVSPISVPGNIIAQGSPAFYVGLGRNDPNTGLPVYEMDTVYEAQTGADLNGSAPDMTMYINTYNLGLDWFDPSGVWRNAPVPSGQVDFITAAMHEMVHGLGWGGLRDQARNDGAFPPGTTLELTYDEHLARVIPYSGWLFQGAEANLAEGGGPVPVSSDVPGSNYYHIRQSGDLMSADLGPGQRRSLSTVDGGILQDLGWLYTPQMAAGGHVTSLVLPSGQTAQVAVAADGHLYSHQPQGGWDLLPIAGAPAFQPGERVGAVALPIANGGSYDVFATGNDGQIYEYYFNGSSWSAPINITAWTTRRFFAGTPVVASNADGVYHAWAVDNTGSVINNWLNTQQGRWYADQIPGTAYAFSSFSPVELSVTYNGGTWNAFAVDTNGNLRTYYNSGAAWYGGVIVGQSIYVSGEPLTATTADGIFHVWLTDRYGQVRNNWLNTFTDPQHPYWSPDVVAGGFTAAAEVTPVYNTALGLWRVFGTDANAHLVESAEYRDSAGQLRFTPFNPLTTALGFAPGTPLSVTLTNGLLQVYALDGIGSLWDVYGADNPNPGGTSWAFQLTR